MNFKCCESLLHRLSINSDKINFCCPSDDTELRVMDIIDEKTTISVEKYLEKRNHYIERFKANDIPEPCRNCSLCEEEEWEEQPQLNTITIALATKCNCDCIYCNQSNGDSKLRFCLNQKEHPDTKFFLKDFYNKNIITEKSSIVISGGEPSILPRKELEYFLYLGVMAKAHITVLSNGIVFDKNIAKILSIADAEIRIAVDSGTRKTFKNIKRVDKYNTVWKNISKYNKSIRENTKAEVWIRYIIILGINDNLQEAKAFIQKCFKLHCYNIEILIEEKWYEKNTDKPVSKNLRETLQYFKSLRKKNIVFFDGQKDWINAQIFSQFDI